MNSPHEYPLPPSTRPSPLASSTAASSSNTRPRPDLIGTPPIPPPRTSSNNKSHSTSASSSRERGSSSKHGRRRGDERGQDRSGRERTQNSSSQTQARDRGNSDSTPPPGRSRRKVPPSPEGPQRAASTREPRDRPSAVAMESRSEDLISRTSTQPALIKEGSTVINRMVVTDPEEDIEREKRRQAEAHPDNSGLGETGDEGFEDNHQVRKSRHDYSNSKRKETTFGDYILGQTIGEGEFGKVKLGWKKDGSVQVAIKLLRRDSLGSNPGRLPKIYREISILRDLSHPNIVRLHEMVETDRHIGIILEYASGGELFDYILNHRYLKDNAARRLFAQLVSGVGYLHKKGIVHRDLKLENLLLDRNRNIIITDFGFANTFNPADELGEEIEYNLTNKEFVKRMGLDRVDANGMRRGDLMQTSCGSPCYAAPELVVSDSLYTGRKVDVWSCGVILYAMLAGYLPFDDDPANPDGDNINLLYRYIVTTPLTFPEYVTPHARDLLRRILVPDPRKRADLFEVARHSWLAEYAHVVSHITSNTTNISDIANTTVPPEDQEVPQLTRSASVREPPKQYGHGHVTSFGGLSHQPGQISPAEEKVKSQRDAKRRTVQVEYVAPQSQTARGAPASGESARPTSSHRTSIQARGKEAAGYLDQEALRSKPLPSVPVGQEPTGTSQTGYSNLPYRNINQGTLPQSTRPPTGGSMTSAASKLDNRQPSRGSYSQPVAPAVATTNAQGRLAQPKGGRYNVSAPMPLQIPTSASIGQPSIQPSPVHTTGTQESSTKGHKRSSTVSSIGEKLFGRSGSIFGGRSQHPSAPRPKPDRRYPPTSMKEPYSTDDTRTSMDSRRSFSYAFRKQSDPSGRPRRFSLLPPSFSFKSFSSSSKDQQAPPTLESQMAQADEFLRSQSQQAQNESRLPTAPAAMTASSCDSNNRPPTRQDAQTHRTYEDDSHPSYPIDDARNYSEQIEKQFEALHRSQTRLQAELQSGYYNPTNNDYHQSAPNIHSSGYHASDQGQYRQNDDARFHYPQNNNSHQSMGRPDKHNILQKSHRKFADAYEYERSSHHSGSSGAARKVMDFFRRRGKARAGEDR
ncbi:hypothetical protein VTO42DRAFT_1859 [Malbranchea cinnamomea]